MGRVGCHRRAPTYARPTKGIQAMTSIPGGGPAVNGGSAPPPRPSALRVLAETVPARLKERDQWVLWRYDPHEGKWAKTPYRGNGYHRANISEPTGWTSFDAVMRRYRED